MKVPVALAIVKMLQRLPKETLTTNLSGYETSYFGNGEFLMLGLNVYFQKGLVRRMTAFITLLHIPFSI